MELIKIFGMVVFFALLALAVLVAEPELPEESYHHQL